MVFSLQTVSRPVISLQTVKPTSVYNMPQDPGQPLLKNTRKHFVETFFSHLFFLQCAIFFSSMRCPGFFRFFKKKNSFFASGGRGHIVESFQLLSIPFMFISFPFMFILFPFKSFLLSCSSHFLSFSSHFLSSPFLFISLPFISFHVHLISFYVHLISFQVLSSPVRFISLFSCSSHILWFSSHVLSSPFLSFFLSKNPKAIHATNQIWKWKFTSPTSKMQILIFQFSETFTSNTPKTL